MDNVTMLQEALKLTGISMGSVFVVLALFFGGIILLKKLFQTKQEKS